MSVLGSQLTFLSEEGTTPGYMARPGESGKYPGVVVIQEWWGLVPHIKEVVDRFAGQGFVALAPDLYHGQLADEPDEARKLAMALERDLAVAEIGSAARYLASLDHVSPKKIGVVGWCMGGGLALSTAAENASIGAAVCFYGRPLSQTDTAMLRTPILGLYAGEDHGISVDEVETFRKDLVRFDVPHEIHLYEEAHHAFFNDTRPVYDAVAAADAWKRTIDWFNRYLT
ncbi:MAG: dienelactone hydrolase family protein [Candidatus Promineifilaceae bacterium]